MELKDKLTKITFHNGMRTIGGTLIEIIYEDSRIFFDFGSNYNPSSLVQPTDLQGLLDSEIVPFVDNLFDPAIPLDGYLSNHNRFKNTAVFLSHMHLDHSKLINYLNPSIDLYCLQCTKSLINSLNINNDFLFPLYNDTYSNTVRDIIGVDDNQVVEIGKIKVKVMPVDHDAYGASGFVITTPDLVVSYTGDIRIHGYRKHDTLAFCNESHDCDVLIIEGVSVSFEEISSLDEINLSESTSTCDSSEINLLNDINSIINNNPNKQITFNYYISNVERIAKIIETCSRTVVLDSYYAYVLKHALGVQAHYYSLDGKDYGLNPNLSINLDDLLQDEQRFFWQLDSAAIKYLNQMKENGIYLHSNASPLGDYDPAYAPFVNQFASRNIEFITASCSGHAYPLDLIGIIDSIKPKLLVPIHSFHPERLFNRHGEVLLPEKQQTI